MNNVSFSGLKFTNKNSRDTLGRYMKKSNEVTVKTIADSLDEINEACKYKDFYISARDSASSMEIYLCRDTGLPLVEENLSCENDAKTFNVFTQKALEEIKKQSTYDNIDALLDLYM